MARVDAKRPFKVGAAAIACAALLGGLWLVCLRIDAWAAGAFARPEMAAALVAVIELALFVGALCLGPPLSAALVWPFRFAARRRSADAPAEPAAAPRPPWPARVLLAATLGGLWLGGIELIAAASLEDHALPTLAGCATVLGLGLLFGLLSGLPIALLAFVARARGSAAPVTAVGLIRLATGSWLAWLSAGLLVVGVLAGATVLRASALDHPAGAAAMDVGALVLAWALALAMAHLIGQRGGRPSRRLLGGLLVAVAVFGGVLAPRLRPVLLPGGLWDLALLGLAAFTAFAAVLALPMARRTRLIALGVAVIAVGAGLGAAYALNRSAGLRDDVAADWRPAVWLVERATAIDADADGFSPLFGGGDCNDHDSTVNPEGVEIPG
ncbi:MAG: hypothetical protein KC620_25685, partial [Myxococcales bacterium]|nr:hypothetical protein [Myxococcales bacterium]